MRISNSRYTSAFSRRETPEVCVSLSLKRGSRECRMRAAPAVSRAKGRTKIAHEHTGQRRQSDIPCAMALRLTSRSCVRKICQNVRTGGSHQPPVAGSEPVRARRPLEPGGERGTDPVSSSTRTVAGALEPEPSKEGSWMMAQNDLVVAGIDVAKDKVDVCIRSLSLKRTFAGTEEGRRRTRNVFYMACLGAATQHNPVLKAFYDRLVAK